MAIPVEGIGMAAFHNGIHGVAWQAVLPEDRSLGLLEMRLIPYIRPQLAPLGTPRGEVGLIDGQFLGILIGDELWLTRYWPDVFGILRLSETHVIIATNRVAIRLEVDVRRDVEVHRAAHVLNHQTVTACKGTAEVDVPHIGADEGLLAGLVLRGGGGLPEFHRAGVPLYILFNII